MMLITMMLAAACATAGLLLAWPHPQTVVRMRLGTRGGTDTAGARRRPVMGAAALVLVVVAVIQVAGQLPHLIAGCAVAGALLAGWKLQAINRGRTRRERARTETAEAIDALTSELESGIFATRALESIARDWPAFAPAASAAGLGGDVPAALRSIGQGPGREAVVKVAAAWELSVRAGASQGQLLDKMSHVLRDERELQREIASNLGPSRATARLLAVLPVLGLALGSGLRGETIHVLIGTMIGSLCLAAGTALGVAGLFWVEHITTTAERF